MVAKLIFGQVLDLNCQTIFEFEKKAVLKNNFSASFADF